MIREQAPSTAVRRLDQRLARLVASMRVAGVVHPTRTLEALIHSAMVQTPGDEVVAAYGDRAAGFYVEGRIVLGLFDGVVPDLDAAIREALTLIEVAGG